MLRHDPAFYTLIVTGPDPRSLTADTLGAAVRDGIRLSRLERTDVIVRTDAGVDVGRVHGPKGDWCSEDAETWMAAHDAKVDAAEEAA